MNFWKAVLIIFVLAVLVFIFVNSAQVSEKSSFVSRRVTDLVLRIFIRDYGSMDEDAQQDMIARLNRVIRKIAHFLEYALLGFAAVILIFQFRFAREKEIQSVLAVIAFCMIYAVTDELHQTFVDGRSPGVPDVLIDTAGAAAGSFLFFEIRRLAGKIKNRHNERTVS